MRIVLNGIPGVGKSTIASRLSKYLSIPHVPERFENNPYLKPPFGSDADITNFQILTMREDYYRYSSGVFEVEPEASKHIFVPKSDWAQLYTPNLSYDYVFYLHADESVIRNRIISRSREGLLETELNLCETRYQRYLKLIENKANIINADQTPSKIVADIHLAIYNKIFQ